jgi:ribosomal protein S12 methylthiotransferase accessory factor
MRIFDRDYRQAKSYRHGTHRLRSPEETLADYMRYMPSMGITRLANVTGLDTIGIPVYMAIRPNSKSLTVSQGKGIDPAAAKASALMESMEIWHTENLSLPLVYDSAAALSRRAAVVDLERVKRRAGREVSYEVPYLWVEGWDLIRERRTFVPFDLVSFNVVIAPDHHPRLFPRTTNGVASGNHILEAISHGLCELIERDAMALWYADESDEGTKATQIDPATITDPDCRELLARLDAAQQGVGIWDITSDIGIPGYFVLIHDRPGLHVTGKFRGSGIHLAPEIALSRALSEAAQSRLTLVAGSRDDMLEIDWSVLRNQDDMRELEEGLSTPPPTLSFAARKSLATDSFESDVALLLDGLKAVGLDSAIVVDLSRPEFGIPVVRVIVPGLENGEMENLEPGARLRAKRPKGEDR